MFWRPSCCRHVIKELVHAFSCAYIELWMHLGSLERYRLGQLLRFFRALQTSRVHPQLDIRTLSMNQFLTSLLHENCKFLLMHGERFVITSHNSWTKGNYMWRRNWWGFDTKSFFDSPSSNVARKLITVCWETELEHCVKLFYLDSDVVLLIGRVPLAIKR